MEYDMWNKEYQQKLQEKMDSIQIIQKAFNKEELELSEKFELLELQKAFEAGYDQYLISVA